MELDKIYNTDCMEGICNLPSNSIDLIVTDPPYIVSKSTGGTVNNIKRLDKSLKQLDEADLRDGYDIEEFADLTVRLYKDDINAYFWCSKNQIPQYIKTYAIELKCKFDILCWHKRNALPTYANKYLSDTEYCLYFHRGSGKTHPENYEDAKTYEVGVINHEDKKLWSHPTIKPLDFISRIVRNSSQMEGVILDPFIGSGTTAVAALQNNRHFIGFELQKDYYDMALKRIEEEKNKRL